jgi:hypothetical protein
LEKLEGDTRRHNALAPPLASEALVRRSEQNGADALAPAQGQLPNRIGNKQDVCPAALGVRHTLAQPRCQPALHLGLNSIDERNKWIGR